ncbi:MAG: cation-transporting P-type ATPase [Gammaproteobacteria bacterium]|nr:cation-transporting P-type ATPase [Gammaproteobacteria bacterium]MDH5304653.1 cation-transporting P-type ATPase [Gammaproteobacteria bacterium]MDH5322603.1 cation-transporting P-type ATPase [Gammaproteobacteria bacterium]
MTTHAVTASTPAPDCPWALPAAELLEALQVKVETGLPESEIRARQLRYGPNELCSTARRHSWSILADQLKSVIVLLLVAASAVSLLFGDTAEGIAILAVVIINSAIGFATERHAIRSMEALRKLGRVETVVRREGRVAHLPAEQLVPGDIVLLEGGDIVTADLRIIEGSGFQADESTLTGESIPVAKQPDPLSSAIPLVERSNMFFKGSAVTRGTGTAVVVATGLDTELGKISRLVTATKSQITPLEHRLNALAARLIRAVLVIAVLVAVAGAFKGQDAVLAIEVAIALAVAAIPEGLPIVATIALARGMWRMSKRHALISRLSAVETLGAANIILTDKTGTLTENRMTVTSLHLGEATVSVEGTGLETSGIFRRNGEVISPAEFERIDEMLTMAALCCYAELNVGNTGEAESIGDPTEIALLVAAAKRKLFRNELLRTMPRVREESFDTQTKSMATFHQCESGLCVAVKGAPEAILEYCTEVRTASGTTEMSEEVRAAWLKRAASYGDQGLRTLAIASREAQDATEMPYRDLTLLGLVAMEDPPRHGVKAAIDRCRNAGISVVMVTGDHAATARNIGSELALITPESGPECFLDARTQLPPAGTPDDEALRQVKIISRATPEQKYELIDRYQQLGHVVAMTGDGVNDAPALRKADIGVAMGLRGTPVAREAAHIILQDDEFATIVEAVSLGRAIYANIRKFVVYLLSCNIGEILIVSIATLAGAPLPLLPLQILFLNLVTDVFPALALGVGGGSKQLMGIGPRPADEPVLTRIHWIRIFAYGALMAATVLISMAIALEALEFGYAQAVTVSFATLALAQLWHVFNMRASGSSFLRNEIVANAWIWVALAICLSLIIAAVQVPALQRLLSLGNPQAGGWLLIILMSFVPLLLGPLVRAVTPLPRADSD